MLQRPMCAFFSCSCFYYCYKSMEIFSSSLPPEHYPDSIGWQWTQFWMQLKKKKETFHLFGLVILFLSQGHIIISESPWEQRASNNTYDFEITSIIEQCKEKLMIGRTAVHFGRVSQSQRVWVEHNFYFFFPFFIILRPASRWQAFLENWWRGGVYKSPAK